MNGIRHTLQVHKGTILLTLSLILVFTLLYLLGDILIPFLIGLVLAYIIWPVISWLEQRIPGKRKSLKRIIIIILIFILILAILGSVGYFVVRAAIDSFDEIVENAPDYVSTSFDYIEDWTSSLRGWMPAEISQQFEDLIYTLGEKLGSIFRNIFEGAISWVPSAINYVMGFAALPLFLFYILKDREYLENRFYTSFSPTSREHARNVTTILTQTLGGYLRAQVTLGLFVGTLAFIGLLIIRAPFAAGLALVSGLTELIPILGPWIGGIIAVLVVLASEPSKVIWVVILFVVIQLVENTILTPRIQSHYLNIHPAITIVLLTTGGVLFGFWGLILAVPLASTLVKLYEYVIKSWREEVSM